ncbi:Holliday junction resolvase RecU [Mycoplasma sp. Pen4]|uniref:Holliday junction resolvase RecU n=1 Tax=Mycoplasma sp. Pen4 TaxID=640330 RepID=UPI00165401D7|nr:Holliday junction resolvase RecU [Mycoplasma sp. Pen4]QNM93508.1 Holliday junction resolvase RecU [Mycoplasma sp. Pen4]
MNNKNKGMFLEEVLNKTITYLWSNKIAYIEKKTTPIKVKKITKNDDGQIISSKVKIYKSTVDYIGCFNGKFIAFEAKTTNEKYLSIKNFAKHQLRYLELIESNNGISFVIIYFSLYNEFYLVNTNYIIEKYKQVKSIKYKEIKENSRLLTLEFPGYLNILIFDLN